MIYRYTDFLVNEIVPSGEVLHLQSLVPPPGPSDSKKIQKEDAPPPKPASKPEPTPEQRSEDQPQGENGHSSAQTVSESSVKAPGEVAEFQVPLSYLLTVD